MRKKKAFFNMSSSLVYQIVAIACGLITPRLLLEAFGSTYNGVVASATQFLNMINLLTLGITASTRVALYKTLGKNDVLGTSRLLKATKNYMHKVGGAVIIYALILCVIYPFISHNELTHIQNATLIAIVSIGTFADYFFGLSNLTLLQADQASYVANIFNIIKTVLNTVCVAVLIYAGFSVYIVKLGSSIVYLIIPIFINIYVKKKYCIVKKCEPDYSGIKQRGAVAFHSISNIVHDNTDIAVLTLFTDAKLISVYSVYYLVIGKIKSLMQVFTSGMEAAFGDMWAKNEFETLSKNFRIYEYMLFSFTVVVFSCVGVLILPFISLYTLNIHDIEYVRPDLAVLICLAEGMYVIRQPYLTLVYSTGSFEDTKLGAAAEAIINVVLSLVLVNFIGVAGVIIGTIVANVFRTIQFAVYVSNHILNRSIKYVAYRFMWVIVCVIIIVSLSFLVRSYISFPFSWIGWIEQGFVMLFVAGAITSIMSLIFYKHDFFALINIARTVFAKS